MQIPTQLGEDRRDVTAGALRLVVKDSLASCSSLKVETVGRRLRHWHRQLVEVQRGELCTDQIFAVMLVTETGFGGDRIFLFIVKTRVEECPLAVHFEIGNKSVPVGDVAPRTGPGVIVDTSQAKSGWNKCGGGLAGRAKIFAIEDQFGIEFSWSPTIQHFAHRWLRDSQQFLERAQVGSRRHDSANIEVAIGPAIPSVTYTGSE